MFPSASAGACEIVHKETVIKARQLISLPIFVAGGLTLENMNELKHAGINGIALISGIMKAENAEITAKQFKEKLESIKNETITNQ